MSPATARLPLASYAPIVAPRTQVTPLLSRSVPDTVRVEDCGIDGLSRMHPWVGISLVRSPTLVSVESRRDVVADRNWIVLIPPFELHELRPQGEAAQRAITLLLGGSPIEGIDITRLPALVTDPALGERVAALVAHVQHGVRSHEQATTIRAMLEQLLLSSIPIAAGRAPRYSRLARVRTFLQTHVSDPVSIQDLARMSALSECHLISAFRYEFGLPPHAYHSRLRLAAACEALARGMAVASVAYEYGFADQSHLSRKFKSVYGVSPAAWATRRAGTLGSGRT
jgi:AraC-like DNA-binding protein